MTQKVADVDVLIVGAGLSGIGMAAHLTAKAPDRSYIIVDRRDDLGGTWDLFRYPGIRSDSDMYTLGFDFEPWRHEKSIADAPAILDYLNRIVDDRGIRPHIRFGQKVISADWHEGDARWHVTIETGAGTRIHLTANWLHLGSGYYDYDEAHDPGFDLREFGGQVIHPQFWPEGLDYAGKQIVVIGSGATAVTLVPAMSGTAAKVTMLQRTPTWMFSRPAKDAFANVLRKVLPDAMAYRLTRWKNIRMADIIFKRARSKPEKVKAFLTRNLVKALGDSYDAAAFTAPYNPWDQRICLVPDSDLFNAIRAGKAEVVTGHIKAFESGGVRLTDDRFLPADVIVTATGLKLAVAGKIALSMNGRPVRLADHFYYKGCMISNLPNLSVVFGYLNASWTLRADINSDYICRVLNQMKAEGVDVAVPVLADDHVLQEDEVFNFSSGYIQRGKHVMPRSTTHYSWRLNQDYIVDRKRMQTDPIKDGILQLRSHGAAPALIEEQLEAAE